MSEQREGDGVAMTHVAKVFVWVLASLLFVGVALQIHGLDPFAMLAAGAGSLMVWAGLFGAPGDRW